MYNVIVQVLVTSVLEIENNMKLDLQCVPRRKRQHFPIRLQQGQANKLLLA